MRKSQRGRRSEVCLYSSETQALDFVLSNEEKEQSALNKRVIQYNLYFKGSMVTATL